jgi:hypothetical protein
LDGIVKEIGVVKTEKSKIKHILGPRTKTHQHSNTARLVGKRGSIQGKGTDNNIRMPKSMKLRVTLTPD